MSEGNDKFPLEMVDVEPKLAEELMKQFTGTTWTQELVWLVANDLDYEKATAIPLATRYQLLENSVHIHPIMYERFRSENSNSAENLELLEVFTKPGTEKFAAMPSPRFGKTHLSFSLLPPTLLDTAKVVYVARDPRDVAVSYYLLKRLLRTHGYRGDFKTVLELF